MDIGPNLTALTDFQGSKMEFSSLAKWVTRSQPQTASFHLLKTRLKAESPRNKQQLKTAAAKAYKGSQKQNLASDVRGLQPIPVEFSSKY